VILVFPGQQRFTCRHGSPLIALRMTFRQLARGNPGALTGTARGLIQAVLDRRGAHN
jgi:hypothetical protein